MVGVDDTMYKACQLGKQLVFELVLWENNVCADRMCHEAHRAGKNIVHWKIAHCEMVSPVEDDLKAIPVNEVFEINREEVQVCCRC